MDIIGHIPEDNEETKHMIEVKGKTPVMERKPSVPLQKLHWNTIPADKLDKSLWALDDDIGENYFKETDIQQLEQLFGTAPSVVSTGARMSRRNSYNDSMNDSSQRTDSVQIDSSKLWVLDGKRAQNIIIGLVQFKSIGTIAEIVHNIMSLNNIGGLLDTDKLSNFSTLLPSDTEMKKLASCTQTQNQAELFIRELSPHHPLLGRRLHVFLVCEQFESHCTSVNAKIDRVLSCSIKVR
jgi:hypothetical protein